MAIIRPFRGLRANPKFVQFIASPPYDTLSTAEARELAARNPKSFVRIDKPEVAFSESTNPYDPLVYLKGRELLATYISEGLLIQDEAPCLYVYRLTMSSRSQTGIMALISVAEYDRGVIKKHEHTRPEKVNDRVEHIIALGGQASPVLSAFRAEKEVAKILDGITQGTPTYDFTGEDSVRHEFWVVSNPESIGKLAKQFSMMPALYIADGHHRSEAASESARRFARQAPNNTDDQPQNYFLSGLFPDNELHIMPYNRVVKDLNGYSTSNFIDALKERFEVTNNQTEVTPHREHEFGIYLKGKWYRAKAKPDAVVRSHATDEIDAQLLAKNVIEPLLGISNPRTDKRIDFIGGIRGTKELVRLVDSGEYEVAFSLFPTSVKQLLEVADAGEVMPPKSTWFEPKLKSGLVSYLYAEMR